MGNKDRRNFVTEEYAYAVAGRSISRCSHNTGPLTRPTYDRDGFVNFARIACLARRELTLKVWRYTDAS